MMIILLAHAKIERRKNPEGTEYDCYSPGLYTDKKNEGPGKIVQEWCDEVFFIRKKKIVRTEKEGFGRERGIAMGSEDREILASETAWASAKNRLNMPTIVDLPRQNAWSVYMQYIQFLFFMK
ncbi:MAG: hypothetical protein EBR82_32960 [Caulobacteraceae bacterium]|nr:hypothetical protein [Caulobacteraceae bacterium]